MTSRAQARRSWRGEVVLGVTAVTGTILIACSGLERRVQELFDDQTPRERYEASLQSAGLAGTALVRDWNAAAGRALEEAAAITTPHAEQGYLPPGEPAALGFRVALRRGQKIAFTLDLVGDSASQVFLDAWSVEGDSIPIYRHVAAADSGVRQLRFEPPREGDYILRAQPELLRGGRFTVSLRVDPILTFPVLNGSEHDVGSVFGDPRDGGVRSHHGIDIFAARGTVAIAAAEAVVTRVGTSGRGGNVVWLRDGRGYSLYYAHLDRPYVREGMRVALGDTIGFIGNTGNAVTTAPHLHFGVYRRGQGPMDPWWFVHRPTRPMPGLSVDTLLLGVWARTRVEQVALLTGPDGRSRPLIRLPRHTTLRVLAGVGEWYRVRLPDGLTGFLPGNRVEPVDRAVEFAALVDESRILTEPAPSFEPEQVIALVLPGDSLPVLGRFGEYLFVRIPGGQAGWMSPRAQ